MKVIPLLFFAFLFHDKGFAQNICTISGDIGVSKNGNIFIVPAIEQYEYYGKNFFVFDSSELKNGKFYFRFRLRDNEIYPFRFLVRIGEEESLTGEVYLRSGKNYIKIDSLNEFVAPLVLKSDVQSEYAEWYLNSFKGHVQASVLLDSLYEVDLESKKKLSPRDKYLWRDRYDSLSKAGDVILSEFIDAHPFSPIATWKLIQRFEANGFRSIYSECFSKLSVVFQKSANGILLERRLKAAGQLSEGRMFPKMSALDLSGREVLIDSIFFRSYKYTLVDFWFHNCGPCIRQFGELKEVYISFIQDGFEVLSISVDKREDFQVWQSRSSSLGLTWKNIIDLGGKESSSYLVNSFPTSFLVDQNGRIVKKNIDIFELREFLDHIKGN